MRLIPVHRISVGHLPLPSSAPTADQHSYFPRSLPAQRFPPLPAAKALAFYSGSLD